ncbi:MAG: hypothetical protein CL535_14245 [Ahrensia sp.]|nr:hypothetical protein [Ahrensia sp.]|tara:strand:+ start:3161 stop:4435 length:1275 start_codon:yes stop_codon:yes gene_type:complete
MSIHDHSLARSDVASGASEDPIRDVLHDPYLKPLSPALCHLAATIFEEVEESNPHTQRRRKDATERKRIVLGNIVANLATLHEAGNLRGSVILDMRNTLQTRYDRREVATPVLREMVSTMAELGWLERRAGAYHKARTTIRPSIKLWVAMGELGAGPHVGRAPGAETVILKAVVNKQRTKGLVDYADTEETRRLRSDVEEINACLAGAATEFDGRPIASTFLSRHFLIEGRDVPRRFDKVGRLYGGWWQSLPRGERHLIRLEGEELADLDFKAAFARLAYWSAGQPIPEDDPYSGVVGLRRGQVKIAVLALLCREGAMKRLPDDLLKSGLDRSWSAAKVEAAIRSRHGPIASLFGCMAGLELMKLEGDILVMALLDLARQGIPALGMHDGLMVAKSRKQQAWTAMEEASRKLLGVTLPVAEKPF